MESETLSHGFSTALLPFFSSAFSIHNSTDPYLILDEQGYIVFASPKAIQLFDRSAEELLGSRLGLPNFKSDHCNIEILKKNLSRTSVQVSFIEFTIHIPKTTKQYIALLREPQEEKLVQTPVLETKEFKAPSTLPLTGIAHQIESEFGIVGKSKPIQALIANMKKAAQSDATVLICGESGTGKELIARAIHGLGHRKHAPFIAINCAAIPSHLLESELFGFAKGAFTNAICSKVGLFEAANGGTLFLDEIGDMPLDLQAKMLRVLQNREIRRIGENSARKVDVRILCATHKNLETATQTSHFREDLYYRLNVIQLQAPPLRERRSDIPELTQFFLKKIADKYNCNLKKVDEKTMDFLMNQPWRGNVRELENFIERAFVMSEGEFLSLDPQDQRKLLQTAENELIPFSTSEEILATSPSNALSISNASPAALLEKFFTGLPSLRELENRYIRYVLKTTGFVKERAAHILKIDRKTLYRKTKELNS